MKYVKEKAWLASHLNEENVRIIDCRFSLAEPCMGKEVYLQSHLPGAVFFDLEKDLSNQISAHGGRHPMPILEDFIVKIEMAGIDHSTTVIAYDNGEGAFASRFWWMMKFIGHENVYVLDGGFKEWSNSNLPLSTHIPEFEKTSFQLQLQHEIIASMEDVKENVSAHLPNTILIDSREEKRYLGLEEPIDKKAGHIPGAINKPWGEGFQNGLFKSIDEQRKRFTDLDKSKTIIVYCGSGVTATPNYLALKEAGFENVKLYLGSFSDWISYEDNEIE